MQTLTELCIAQPLFDCLSISCNKAAQAAEKVVFSYQVFLYSYSLFKIVIPYGTNNYGGQGLAVKKISRMQFP